MKFVYVNIIWQLILLRYTKAADDDYNILHKDGSFEFGYTNPDSYHYADGSRNNVVKGEFGGRNPKTGAVDTTVYTAGPRGFRPRGKNVYRKYDLNQNGPRPVGSRDDPYYDPYEDPSYNFAFKTRTYSRQESANRVGDVTGRFTYLDDVGERHNVEFIAGKNTGYHVKTPFPDSNPRAYGPLYFRGRGRPIPRGRTSIQRGLDGSYKFVSAGPDQRRTEVSDSTGHVRGSYTYLDDKGVQHSVHYIAGPETGYRVLKTVKGAHLPTVFPFERPEIIPPDFYEYGPEGDVFDTAASGRPFKPGGKPSRPSSDVGNGIDVAKEDYGGFGGEKQDGGNLDSTDKINDDFGNKKPGSSLSKPSSRPGGRPGGKPGTGPVDAGGGYDTDDDEASFDFGDLFGGEGGSSTTTRPGFRPPSSRPSSRPTGRPTITSSKPIFKPGSVGDEDDGSYKPDGDDGSYRPAGEDVSTGFSGGSRPTTAKPGGSSTQFPGYPSGRPTSGPGALEFDDEFDFNKFPDKILYGSESGRPLGGGSGGSGGYEGNSESGGGILQVEGGKKPCPKCTGTIVTNIGYKPFHVPPGVSVRAHVQSIDLYPYDGPTPSEAFKADSELKREQLNEASSESPTSTKETEAPSTDTPTQSTSSASVQTTTEKVD